MLPFLTHPMALAGLAAAVPALVAIYWLRRRFRRYPVSSLMLWLDPRPPREGGSRLDRLQTPLLFFLELAALILLVLAAADPQVQSAQRARPLVVVLDDSFSMRAGGADSPRSRAIGALEQELRRSPRYSVRFVLAGEPSRTGCAARRAAPAAGPDSAECRSARGTYRVRRTVDHAKAYAGGTGGRPGPGVVGRFGRPRAGPGLQHGPLLLLPLLLLPA
jgi:hypothetical protein